jgi:hypothetical protein
MAHAVRADRHPGGRERPDVSHVEEPRSTQPARYHEEGCGQATPAKRRKRMLHVRGIAVVERDPDITPPGDRVERGLEPIRSEPHLLLARLQEPPGLANAVEGEIDRPLPHAGR